MKKLTNFSKDERSLLLFLETQAVDYGGAVDSRHMNDDDHEIITKWNKSKFIEFGRVAMDDIVKHSTHCRTHWVTMSDEAMNLAHEERCERAKRMWKRRTWHKTIEV